MIMDQTKLFETKENLHGLDTLRFEGENLEKMNIKQLQDLLDKVEKLGAGKESIILNIPEGFLGFYERNWGKTLVVPPCVKKIIFPGSFIGIHSAKKCFQFLPENRDNKMFPAGKYLIEAMDDPFEYGILNCSKAAEVLREDCRWKNEISYSELSMHTQGYGDGLGIEYLGNGTCFTINRVRSFDDSEVLESHSLEISKKFEFSLDGLPVSLERIMANKNEIAPYQTVTGDFSLEANLLVLNNIREIYGIEYESHDGFSLTDIWFEETLFYKDNNYKKPVYGFCAINVKHNEGGALSDFNHEDVEIYFNGKNYEADVESYEQLLSAVDNQIALVQKQKADFLAERKRELEEEQRRKEEEALQEQRRKEEEKAREALFTNIPKESLKFTTVKTKDMEIKFGSLTKYKGKDTEIALPDSVERIWIATFAGNKSLKAVKIPESVFDIQASAFQGCTALETVNIPNSIKSIAEKTFYGCSSLKEITIPESVIRISEGAFSKCTSLTKESIHCEDWINKDDLLAGKKLEKI